MGFSQARLLDDGRLVGGYARVWQVEDKGKYSVVQLSTSNKKQDGTYETDFQNNFVRFVGKAHTMAQGITDPVSIQIKNCDVTRYWSKEKEKEYINFVVFDFDFMDGPAKKSTTKKASPETSFDPIDEDIDDEMPFI